MTFLLWGNTVYIEKYLINVLCSSTHGLIPGRTSVGTPWFSATQSLPCFFVQCSFDLYCHALFGLKKNKSVRCNALNLFTFYSNKGRKYILSVLLIADTRAALFFPLQGLKPLLVLSEWHNY